MIIFSLKVFKKAIEMGKKIGIIGAGPAGLTAGIYCARGGFETVLFAGPQPGGQLLLTTDVENYPGFSTPIQGPFLMEQMEAQAVSCGCQIKYESVRSVDFSGPSFQVHAQESHVFDAVIIATGASAKWLGLESETFFRGFGVSACAVCDGGFFKGKDVAVVGGGSAAVEEALYLARHCKNVFLLHRRDALRAEKVLQQRLERSPNIHILWNHIVKEILGQEKPKKVTSLRLQNLLTEEVYQKSIDGIFIAIGHHPNTELFRDTLTLDPAGYIVCEKGTCFTNIPGVFAAGDVMDPHYRQAVTAAGLGCMAALDAGIFLESKE